MATKRKFIDIPGAKPHQVYRLNNGQKVPGGSFIAEIAGSWQSKKFLTKWANDLGLAGYSMDKYVDTLADVGTVTHGMVQNYFFGLPNDDLFHHFAPATVAMSKTAFGKFEKWASHFDFEPILVEGMVKRGDVWVPYREDGMVSEIYKFGGTIDFFGRIKHKQGEACTDERCVLFGLANEWFNILLDWKTCKNLYKKHLYQVAGYNTLAYENGFESQLVAVLKIGRTSQEGFKVVKRRTKEILHQWEIFRLSLQLLTLQNAEPEWLS